MTVEEIILKVPEHEKIERFVLLDMQTLKKYLKQRFLVDTSRLLATNLWM